MARQVAAQVHPEIGRIAAAMVEAEIEAGLLFAQAPARGIGGARELPPTILSPMRLPDRLVARVAAEPEIRRRATGTASVLLSS